MLSASALPRLTRRAGLALLALPLAGFLWQATGASAAEEAVEIPPPALDQPAAAGSETIWLAGGCFWGVQGVFQHTKGVTSAVSGYAGGTVENPSYEAVSSGATGHAETVAVTFDPHQVSLGKILQIYFSVAHNPTQLNYQGPDHGTQYRSAIFYGDAGQQAVAEAYVKQLDAAGRFGAPIVTEVTAAGTFYPAEDYHQDYLTLHPDSLYIQYNDLPKIEALARLFRDYYRETPVLVMASN